MIAKERKSWRLRKTTLRTLHEGAPKSFQRLNLYLQPSSEGLRLGRGLWSEGSRKRLYFEVPAGWTETPKWMVWSAR